MAGIVVSGATTANADPGPHLASGDFFKNDYTGQCMSRDAVSGTSSYVSMIPCDPYSVSLRWDKVPIPNTNRYQIVSRYMRTLCLSPWSASFPLIHLYTCNPNDPLQQWWTQDGKMWGNIGAPNRLGAEPGAARPVLVGTYRDYRQIYWSAK